MNTRLSVTMCLGLGAVALGLHARTIPVKACQACGYVGNSTSGFAACTTAPEGGAYCTTPGGACGVSGSCLP
jgi:hypothetical protein